MSEQVCGVVFVDDEHHITCSLPQGHAGPHGWRLAPSPAAASDVPLEAARKALESIKVRLHFVGMPQEPMRNGRPDWAPWISELENALKVLRSLPANTDPGIVQCRSCGGYHPCLRAIEAPRGKE